MQLSLTEQKKLADAVIAAVTDIKIGTVEISVNSNFRKVSIIKTVEHENIIDGKKEVDKCKKLA